MLCRMATTASSIAGSGFTPGATGQAQSIAAGAQADVRGTLTAVHFRDEHFRGAASSGAPCNR